MKISVVSFDLTGTLLKPFPSIGELCVEAMREQGIAEIPDAGEFNARRDTARRVAQVNGNEVKVTVGSVEHPMSEEHSILWVYLETDAGIQRKPLQVGKPPVVTFALGDEKPIAVYAYCNLHGLWKSEIN